ncbi:ATP-binding protein [Terrihabitans sp. B22-R8]|uniref:ATP-binding protein n=1 Tax=Terrihabitans sp. B22-R8 TaxID=3425128 RepID=UPI00403CC4D2
MTALGKLLRTTAFKMALGLLGVFALTAVLSLGYVLWQSSRIVQAQIDEAVRAEVAGLAQRYASGGMLGLVREVENRVRGPGAFLYLVTSPMGEPLAGNVAALPPGVLDRAGARETDYTRKGSGNEARAMAHVRVFVLPSGFRLLVGRDLAERRRFAEVLAQTILGGLVLVILLGLVGGLIVARRVLVRLDALTATSRTIMAGDLSQRLPVSGSGDEFDRLAIGVNAMLERISELMAGMRQVTDDVAHDLKTPLTRLRNRAEEALRIGRRDEDYRAALEQVIEESDALLGTFNSMLMIARAESGASRDMMKPLDVGELLASVADLYEPVAEDAGFALTCDPGSDETQVRGNRELLAQAMANLVDNALKYGAPAAPDVPRKIALQVETEGERVRLVVADHGPGIADADRARVLERFVRLETSRTLPGSGLGLSLVNAIAHLHGGVLVLADNHPGLRASIELPRV